MSRAVFHIGAATLGLNAAMTSSDPHIEDTLRNDAMLAVADDIDVDETPFGAEAGETPGQDVEPPPVEHHPASGVAYALGAYGWWGFVVPLFIYWFRRVDSVELLALRVATGLPVAMGIVVWSRRTNELRTAFTSAKTYGYLAITTALIAVNWFGFIYVISHKGMELQASLGYYMTPLLSVALGMIVLGERLRPLQWLALGLGAVGVVVLAVGGQAPTWALALALSFSFYGLLRKRAHVGPIVGITVETANMFVPALIILAWRWNAGSLTFLDEPSPKLLAIGAAGAVTVIPLLWFNHGARRLRLSTLGFIQFIAPTGQFLLAVLLMGSEFGGARVVTFALIWVAIVVFLVDSVRHHRRARATAGA